MSFSDPQNQKINNTSTQVSNDESNQMETSEKRKTSLNRFEIEKIESSLPPRGQIIPEVDSSQKQINQKTSNDESKALDPPHSLLKKNGKKITYADSWFDFQNQKKHEG